MQLSEIERAEKWVILMKALWPSLIGIFVILLTYFAYRWKVNADKRAMEELDPERLRLKMQAVIAERMARKVSAPAPSSSLKAQEKESEAEEKPPDEIQEDEILSF